MYKPMNQLFYYLEKESITIDKSEFEFQIQSHPNYPSILSISDTLNFFSINNIFTSIDFSEIESLPYRFIILLEDGDNKSSLFLLEKKDKKYFLHTAKKPIVISNKELEKRWNKIVLLVENSEEIEKNNLNNKINWFLPIMITLSFIFFLNRVDAFLYTKLFILLPIIGIVLSIFALKDLFGVKNEAINNFCNVSSSTNCNDVVNSSKWEIFKYLSFSDLSIVFFTSQIFALLFSLIYGDSISFLRFQTLLLYCSIPFILLSIYYQKSIVKKWCPICLSISALLIFEILYLSIIKSKADKISIPVLVFLFIFLAIYYLWNIFKKTLLTMQYLKKFQLKSIRSLRDYNSFKIILLSKGRIDMPQANIVLGNKNSKTLLTIISNPFCGHCKEAHEIIDKMLKKKGSEFQVQIILKSNFEHETEDSKKVFRRLINIYNFKGELEFQKALKYWFENKNRSEWLNFHDQSSNLTEFDNIISKEFEWCSKNDINFTPAIFINGYLYPSNYERKELEFFINELIEDSDFN